MISVKIFRNNQGNIYGFEAVNHGNSIVCSAVSILTFNAVNSIEKFTNEKCACEYKEKGGFLKFSVSSLENGETNENASLLLNSMLLGLNGIQQSYKNQLKIIELKGGASNA